MKKTKVIIPAKINLTLDLLGVNGGYHELESLVASIDVVDAVTVFPKKSGEIGLRTKGIPCRCPKEKNNAYKAAQAFFAEHDGSADIVIEKNIPLGGGLGGSSADAAGVLKALGIMYGEKKEKIERLAESVGSDVKYMLSGGYAVMRGRGERVEKIESGLSLPLLVLVSDYPVKTAECYRLCDELGLCPVNGTAKAVKSLLSGDTAALKASLFNGMTEAAKRLNGQISGNLAALESAGGAAAMSGSGGTTFAVFETETERDCAYRKLFPAFGDKLIKCKTI